MDLNLSLHALPIIHAKLLGKTFVSFCSYFGVRSILIGRVLPCVEVFAKLPGE